MLDKYFKEIDLCNKIWKEKYLISKENLPSDRINTIAKIVNNPEINQIIKDAKFIPAGRILYGLGRENNVTFMNCYVLEILEDSIHGIFQTAEQLAEVYKTGGGAGINLSPLRPRNSEVNNAAETSTGSVSFAKVYNEVTETVGQLNRRGALMLIEDCQHPDIFEFISVKDDDNKNAITSANISVAIRDTFMLAVQEDENWELWYPYENEIIIAADRYFKVKTINACYDYPEQKYFYVESDNTYREKKIVKLIKAIDLWNEIIKRAHSSAEPGLLFIDTIKEDHTVEDVTPIVGCNPCITKDTLILTNKGWEEVQYLTKPFMINYKDKLYDSFGFFCTGIKPVYLATFSNGMQLKCTNDHKIYTNKGKIPLKNITNEYIELAEYKEPIITINKEFCIGYLLGHLIGDGYLKKNNTPILEVWADKGEIAFINLCIKTVLNLEKSWNYNKEQDKSSLSLPEFKNFLELFEISHGKKELHKVILKYSLNLQAGVVSGLFDTDGSVQGTQNKGYSVRLAQSNYELLKIAQLLLQKLGVQSKVLKRRDAHIKSMPNGKGDYSDYQCKSQWELIVSSKNIEKLSRIINFANIDKNTKLQNIINSVNFYNIKSKVTLVSTEYIGEEEVYDCTVEKIHKYCANGIVISNCGEQSLPNYGACNLGSINLGEYIENKFTSSAYFNEDIFIEDVRQAIRFLDNIVDLNKGRNALKEQDVHLEQFRRIGLGIMGYADMLAYMKIPYDSASAFHFTEDIFDLLETVAWQESFELAKKYGAFPAFDPIMTESGHLAKVIESGILDYDEVCKYGVRNATLLSIAPTGTIALIAQASSGIEPIFALNYTRNSDSLSQSSFKVYHHSYKKYCDIYGEPETPPDFFKTAYEIDPITRIKLQGLIQNYIDTGISVTVNFPKSATIKEIETVYFNAWESGCKGSTIYREGSRSQILVAGEDIEPANIRERYDTLNGKTIVIPYKQKIYLTANYNPVSDKIVEVFISSAKSGSDIKANYEAFGRLISLYLQEGGEIERVIKTLIDIKVEDSIFTKNGIYHSVPDVIAKSLQKLTVNSIGIVNKCPDCGNEIVMENGCMSCKNCGFSKCG